MMWQFLIFVLHVFKSEMWNVHVAEEGECAGRSREHPESGLTCFVIGFFRKSPDIRSSWQLPACASCGAVYDNRSLIDRVRIVRS